MGAVARTIGSAVVSWTERAAVVVSKFYEHIVASYDLVGDFGETVFDGVGAERPTASLITEILREHGSH